MKIIEPLEVSKYMINDEFIRSFGGCLELEKNLAEYSTFHTGGNAKYFIEIQDADDLISVIKNALKYKISYFVMGGGSNLLISDKGYDGLIIKINIRGVVLLSETEIGCGSGEKLMDLVNFSAQHSLCGLEFAAGIAGSVGGAVVGNAGAYGGEIKDVLTEITVVDEAGIKKNLLPSDCQFSYRDSYLKRTKDIVVEVKLNLEKGNKNIIEQKINEILADRKAKHPTRECSAGSFFKNIPDAREKYGKIPAGRLLEQVGAKGISVGGASVYEKHANMIINSNNATSKDIRELADILKEKVFDEFGITLEEEVISLGEF